MILSLFLLVFILSNIHQSSSTLLSNNLLQQDTSLYLYFDESDKKQVAGYSKSLYYAQGKNISERFYKGDIYWYRYSLYQHDWIRFLSIPEKPSFEVEINQLKNYKILDIQMLKNKIDEMNKGNLYTTKGDGFLRGFKDIYLVKISNNKASIIPVRFDYDLE